MERRARRAWARWCSGGLQRGQWDQLCQLPEVLDRCSQEELVSSTKWPPQPEPIEAQDALEMCEQHLDLLPFAPRRHVGFGPGDVACDVTGAFVDGAWDLASGDVRTTTWLKLAGIAVTFAGAIEQCCPIIHQSSGRGQLLAGWTDVDIGFLIIGEGFARERPIGAYRRPEYAVRSRAR